MTSIFIQHGYDSTKFTEAKNMINASYHTLCNQHVGPRVHVLSSFSWKEELRLTKVFSVPRVIGWMLLQACLLFQQPKAKDL